MTRKTLIYGTMVLFAANLFNRVLAFINQYLIMDWVGAEAYGIYQMVFPTYMMALVLTTAGLPLAVSKLVSEEMAKGNKATALKIFRTALFILLLSGVLFTVILYLLIPYLSKRLFPDPRVLPVFVICLPALFIVAASSAFRGYFQGLQEMRPTAVAQVCEQVTRVVIGLGVAVKLLPRGIEFGAVGLAIGMVSGELVGLVVTLLIYHRHQKHFTALQDSKVAGRFTVLRKLFSLGLPVTAGRLVSSAASSADSILIPLRLQVAGYSLREATTLYGQLGGAALTLLTFPTVFTFSLATSLVPAISEALAKKQWNLVRHRTTEAIRLTVLVGAPFLVYLYFFGAELSAIFKSPDAGEVLSTLSIAGIFMYLQGTTAGILQGLGHPQIPVIHLMIASLLKLIFIYHLTAIPALGLVGTAWSYNFAFILTSVLNLVAINHKVGLALDIEKLVLQPLAAAALMGITIYFSKDYFSSRFLLLVGGFWLGGAVYLATLFVNKGITKEDLRRIPVIGRFITI